MSLPWVKLHVSLIDNDVFKRLSRSAKLTFYTAIPLAAKQEQDGALALRTGAMTVGEIAYYTGLGEKQQAEALLELEAAGFLSRRLDGAYVVDRWKEKTGDVSTTRVKRFRERSGNSDETFQKRKCNATEEDKERRVDPDSLRSSAEAFGNFPEQVARLRELAVLFVAAFANCKDPAKVENHLPAYTRVLAQIRGRGFTIAQAWQACSDALEANGDKPLFSEAIKSAMSFLPARAAANVPAAKPALRVVTREMLEAAP